MFWNLFLSCTYFMFLYKTFLTYIPLMSCCFINLDFRKWRTWTFLVSKNNKTHPYSFTSSSYFYHYCHRSHLLVSVSCLNFYILDHVKLQNFDAAHTKYYTHNIKNKKIKKSFVSKSSKSVKRWVKINSQLHKIHVPYL